MTIITIPNTDTIYHIDDWKVLRMMMEVGRTEAEEQEELRRQIHNFENDPSVIILVMLMS